MINISICYTTHMATVGIDEVGCGCWAGPLVAGAVVLRSPIQGLKDSKKLSKKQRELLTIEIKLSAEAIGLGWVQAEEIDDIGLTESVRLAMQRAVEQVDVPYNEIIIDGNINYLSHDPRSVSLIKADDLVPSVSAASIVAKVARDTWMANEAHQMHPEYEFGNHVGYGTKRHIELLQLHGVSPLHRKSYKPIQALL
jgi:ribonuclease HII